MTKPETRIKNQARMTKPETRKQNQARMTNDQMTKREAIVSEIQRAQTSREHNSELPISGFGHSSFGLDSGFGFRHSGFRP